MNDKLQKFARDDLKKNLSQCTPGQQLIFKRMYSHKNLDAEINAVVDKMSTEKLDWAMRQVQRAVDENQKSEAKS